MYEKIIKADEKMEFYIKSFGELAPDEVYEILKSRSQVFMFEQNIHYLDMDDVDYDSLHCFLKENGRVEAYLRAFRVDGQKMKIGRVLTLSHGKGNGRRLMQESMKAIAKSTNCKKICLDSQTHAVGFYENFGFKVTSEEFLEAGIPHVEMELEL